VAASARPSLSICAVDIHFARRFPSPLLPCSFTVKFHATALGYIFLLGFPHRVRRECRVLMQVVQTVFYECNLDTVTYAWRKRNPAVALSAPSRAPAWPSARLIAPGSRGRRRVGSTNARRPDCAGRGRQTTGAFRRNLPPLKVRRFGRILDRDPLTAAIRGGRSWQSVSQIRSFDPNAEETVFLPRLVGG
jgi:hypothetical protein